MSETGRVMRCPECGRVASVPSYCQRPICVHSWDGSAPEIWDGDEQAPNPEWRTPGPKTWTEMVPYELERALRDAVWAAGYLAEQQEMQDDGYMERLGRARRQLPDA